MMKLMKDKSNSVELNKRGDDINLSRFFSVFKRAAVTVSSTAATKLSMGSMDESIGSISLLDADFDCSEQSWELATCFQRADSTRSLTLGDLENSNDDLHHGCSSATSTAIISYGSFHDSYCLGQELGSGQFGTVFKCISRSSQLDAHESSNSIGYAVKTVSKDAFDENEINLLEDLKACPNIVHVENVFFEQDRWYLVMPECRGGDLLARIEKKDCFSEQEAKIVSRTLIETVAFCHSRGIVHRDLKPENILMKHEDDDVTIQLADFGLAKRFYDFETGNFQRLKTFCGTIHYSAPEVFGRDGKDETYDERCDNWSIGIIIYILCAGYHPFDAEGDAEMLKVISKGTFHFHKRHWKHISNDAKDIISKLIEVSVDERLELDEALAAPWFQ